jgi:hypothetical protein
MIQERCQKKDFSDYMNRRRGDFFEWAVRLGEDVMESGSCQVTGEEMTKEVIGDCVKKGEMRKLCSGHMDRRKGDENFNNL